MKKHRVVVHKSVLIMQVFNIVELCNFTCEHRWSIYSYMKLITYHIEFCVV